MKHLFQKAKQQKKAFTLVELLIVVGIIGILVVTLVVAVDFSTDKAKTSGVNNILRTYETAASKAALQEAGFVDDLTQLANLLNKSLDSEFKVSVMNDVLTTSATDPWGQTIKIGYSKPEGTVGQLKFVSSGPDMKLGNTDDISSTVTFKRNEGSGEVLINHPENNTSHVHAYNQHVQSDEYMAQKGNCKKPAVYYVSCSCGDVGYETFNGIVDPNNHVNSQVSYEYVNGEIHNTNKKCIDCGATIETKEEPHVGENVCSLCYGVIHTHAFNQTNIEEKFLYKAATCTSKAVYFYSCSCGNAGTETFEFGSVLAHDYTAQVISNGYLAENATCVQMAKYFYSCTMCGDKGTLTFNHGDFNRENHVGLTTYEYSRVDANQHIKNSICNACSNVKTSTTELHTMNEMNTCTLCGTHVHIFDKQIASDSYLRDSATCTSKATYFYSCECGGVGSEYFESGEMAPHTYTAEITEPEYLKSNATCINKSVYYKSCEFCGAKGTDTFEYGDVDSINHIGTTKIKYESISDTQHTKNTVCSSCNAVITSVTEAHVFNANNDCTLCNNHVHVFDKQVVDNKYLKSEATCVAKAVYYYSCKCGEAGTTVFEYGNKTDHIFTAEIPSEEYLKTAATCIDKAVYYRSCTGCGLKGTTVFTVDGYDANNHVGVEIYVGTKEVHSKYSCCSATISTVHSYTKTTEVPATCIAMGTSRYTCDCTYTYTDVDIPINPNNHVGQVVYGGTKDVHTKYDCCDATISSTHTYDQNVVDDKYFASNANCVDKAAYYKSCKCGYSNKSTTFTIGSVDSSNHKGPEVYGGTKTCHIKCEACGVTLQGEGYHEMKVVPGGTSATCTSDGAVIYRCDCGYGYTTVIPKLGHAPATTPTWTSDHSKATVSCTRSGCTASWSGTSTEIVSTNATCTTAKQYYHRVTINVNGTSKTFTCGTTHTGSALGHAPATTPTWTSDHSKATVSCTRSGCTASWSGNATKKVTISATCTVAEQYQHTATFSVNGTSKTFTCGTTHTASALGHAPATTPTWTSDHSKATVNCTRSGCTASWSGNSTVNVISNATCTSANTYNHKATFSVNGTTKTFTCPTTHSGSALGHIISNPPKNITWTNDNKRVTITCERAGCGQTWTYDLVAGDAEITDVVNPTCTTTGSYKCIIKVTINGQEYSFKCPGHTTAALGHAPATTATWSSDHSTATVKCTRTGCSKTWSGNSIQNSLTPAACVSANTYNHTATFDVNGTTKTFTCSSTHSGGALGHLPATTPTWNSDHSVATVACTRSGCSQTWSGNSTTNAISGATCTSANTYNHKATFSVNGTTKTFTCGSTHSGGALGHLPATTPTWNSDHSVATIACTRSGCTTKWSGNSTINTISGATCTSANTYNHKATFSVNGTTKTFTCPTTHSSSALGHLPATTATWNADHSVATVACTRSGCTAKWSGNSTVNATSNATCTSANTYNHKATFSVNGITKTFTCPATHSGSALGHIISNPPKNITWTNDNKRVTITCERSGCGQTWTYDLVAGDAEITDVVNPTCTTTGSYKCIIKVTINGKEYSFKCPGHTTAALGHAPATTATWTTDHSKATVKCTRTGCSKTWSGTSTEVTSRSATCTVARQYYHTATFSVNGTSKTFKCGTHTASKHSHTWSYTCDTICNCCGCTRTASHNMQQTKAPTCTATGTKTCSYGCGTTETIAALGHDYSNTSSSYEWSTTHTSCTGTRPCGRSGCSYVFTENATVTKTNETAPTCTAQGKHDYRASFATTTLFSARSCPDWHYKDALGHNWGSWTDYSSSQHKRTCSRCSTVDYGSHSWTTTKAATCTATGTRKCNTCGRTETIAALGHSYGSWSKYSSSQHKRTCSRCSNVEYGSHSWTTTKSATCTATGTKTCSTCSGTETIAKLGHSWTTTKAATCGASGSRKCSRCSTTETIAATGNHTKPSGQAQYPTCTENVCCTVCSKEIYAKLECGGVTGRSGLLYNYYTQEWYQWLIGNCTKYEACCQATRTGTCDKVYDSWTVDHSSQGSHSHR